MPFSHSNRACSENRAPNAKRRNSATWVLTPKSLTDRHLRRNVRGQNFPAARNLRSQTGLFSRAIHCAPGGTQAANQPTSDLIHPAATLDLPMRSMGQR
jgi:hypothetical protein